MMMRLDLSLGDRLVQSPAAQCSAQLQYPVQRVQQTCSKGTHRKASKHANAFGHIDERQLLRCGHNDSR